MQEPRNARDAGAATPDGTPLGGQPPRGLAAWNLLADDLAGREPKGPAPGEAAFEARATGLLGGGFDLLAPDGRAFGRLVMRGLPGADLALEGVAKGRIERRGLYGARYKMTTVSAQVLIAGPERRPKPLRVFCAGRAYAVETSRLPNRSVARPLGAEEAPGKAPGEIRVSGGLAGRRYAAALPRGDGGALAVAVFLVYRAVALRRQEH